MTVLKGCLGCLGVALAAFWAFALLSFGVLMIVGPLP